MVYNNRPSNDDRPPIIQVSIAIQIERREELLIGVLAGIVFLAVELNQNRQTLEQQLVIDRLSARDAALESFNGFREKLLENPYLIPVWNKGRTGEALTADEDEQFSLLCSNYIWSQVTLYARFAALDLVSEVDATVTILRGQSEESERFRECWDSAKGMISRRGYAELVELVEDERP